MIDIAQKSILGIAVFCLTSTAGQAATLLSANLSSTSGGTEAAAQSTWLAASFGTDSSSYTLDTVTIKLANLTSTSVSAQAALYSDDALGEPGSLVGALSSNGSYSTALSGATFTATGISLDPDSTYWVVLTTTAGELDWSYASGDNGTGAGFQDRWAASYDTGASWYVYASAYNTGVDPLQMDVIATSSIQQQLRSPVHRRCY